MKLGVVAVVDFEVWTPMGGTVSYLRQLIQSLCEIPNVGVIYLYGATLRKGELFPEKYVSKKRYINKETIDLAIGGHNDFLDILM